ncbi:MAG TPA: hypothetical protein VNV37_08670 [Solirubrobacteraceae bacterium]|nr:hypothetical protein [Solirubrobacteraceae bacterium]
MRVIARRARSARIALSYSAWEASTPRKNGSTQGEHRLGAGVGEDRLQQPTVDLLHVLVRHGQRQAVLAPLREHLSPRNRSGGEILNLVYVQPEGPAIRHRQRGAFGGCLPQRGECQTANELGGFRADEALGEIDQQNPLALHDLPHGNPRPGLSDDGAD